MIKTFVFKLYKSKHNKRLHRMIDAAGRVYNHCIALHKHYYRLFHKSLNRFQLEKHLTKLKKSTRFSYMFELGSWTITDIVARIDKAYKLFFNNLECGAKTNPPSFKKIKKYKSFTLRTSHGSPDGFGFPVGNALRIGKKSNSHYYHFFKSRELEGKVKTLTIKRDVLGDIYLYFACEIDQSELELRSGKSVGYDFGLKKFLTASDEQDITAPLFLKRKINAIRKANRKLSQKKKGSGNRERARLDLARLHRKVTNQRHDFHFKTARDICQQYAVVCLEDLNLKGMTRLWGHKMSDYGFYAFTQILDYLARYKFGSRVVKIDRFYPSSQICNQCGYQNKAVKNLTVREWDCPNCGTHHDRDRNAAINIHRVGVSTLRRDAVRPASRQASLVSDNLAAN